MFKENKGVLLYIIKLSRLVIKWGLIEMLCSLLSCLEEGRMCIFSTTLPFVDEELQNNNGTSTRVQLC